MRTLNFYLKTKETLNSNRMPNAMIVKSKLAASIRELGQQTGVLEHDTPEKSAERLKVIISEQNISKEKARVKKRLNANKEDPEIIAERLKEVEENLRINLTRETTPVDYLFKKFTVKVTVCSPSKRRTDPVNFYPTIKHLIDGLTDSSWWEDDSFDQLVEISFRYGGMSDKKDYYQFILEIEETA